MDIAALPCAFPGIASKLIGLTVFGGSPDAEQKLIARLRRAPNREWAESWLDLAKELIEVTGMDRDDERLVMSLPEGKFLPITINRRYVLTAFRIEKGHHTKRYLQPLDSNPPDRAVMELILPSAFSARIDQLPHVIRHNSFDPGFSGETKDNTPLFISFSMSSEFDISPDVREAWHEAAIIERKHQRASKFRKYHEPVVYRVVVDVSYRRRILNAAFA